MAKDDVEKLDYGYLAAIMGRHHAIEGVMGGQRAVERRNVSEPTVDDTNPSDGDR